MDMGMGMDMDMDMDTWVPAVTRDFATEVGIYGFLAFFFVFFC